MPIAPTLADGVAGNIERRQHHLEDVPPAGGRGRRGEEDAIATAMRWAVEVPHLLLEGSAVLGIAALQAGAVSGGRTSHRGRHHRTERDGRAASRRPGMTPEEARRRFVEARVARLATVAADGSPHIVPVTFALEGDRILTAVDAKPKRGGRARSASRTSAPTRRSRCSWTSTTPIGASCGGHGPTGRPP